MRRMRRRCVPTRGDRQGRAPTGANPRFIVTSLKTQGDRTPNRDRSWPAVTAELLGALLVCLGLELRSQRGEVFDQHHGDATTKVGGRMLAHIKRSSRG